MNIQCSHDELVEPHKLVPHPKNPNEHPEEQIAMLSRVLDFQGQRSPIVVCKTTGFVVVGHGRLQAIKKLGWEKCAVNYQEFTNEAQLYAHMTADNATANWASLNLSRINEDFTLLGPDFNVDMLGIKDFVLEPMEKIDPDYSLLDDSDLDSLSISNGVKKAIMIEFDIDYYEDAYEMIQKLRKDSIDPGDFVLSHLRNHFNA